MKKFLFIFFALCAALLFSSSRASAGTCPSGANYLNTQNPSGALVTLASINITNCLYIGIGGSDSNDGASEASGHPWLHAPGMTTCTANCASHTVSQHDGFIFEGGYVLHEGNNALSPYTNGWNINGAGGSLSTPVYYGVDPTWFSGGSWVRPIINGDNPLNACPTTGPCPVSSCPYSGQSFVTPGGTSFVVFDDFELTGLCTQVVSEGNNDYFHIHGPTSSNVPYFFVAERNYIHGWTSTVGAGQNAPNAFDGNGQNSGEVLQMNVIDGTDSDSHALSPFGNNNSDAYIIRFNIDKYTGGDSVASSCHIIDDNVFEYLSVATDGGHGDTLFCEGEYKGGSAAPNLFYNNTFQYIGTTFNVSISYVLDMGTPSGQIDYIFNNTWHDNQPITTSNYVTDEDRVGNWVVFNNTGERPTAESNNGCIICAVGSAITAVGNHWVATPAVQSSIFKSAPASESTPVYMTNATATSQGYTSANNYIPTAASNSTIGAGTNEFSGYCSLLGDANAIAACHNGSTGACTIVSYGGGEGVSCPAVTPNSRGISSCTPSVGTTGCWDAGAYQFVSANNVYVAQLAGTFSGGTACNGQTAVTVGTFNTLTLTPGEIVWICGIINQPLGGPGLKISQSGTVGNPITINFDTGAVLESPAWGQGTNSAIYLSNQSYVVINGGNTTPAGGTSFPTEPAFWTSGVIQNYANGSSGTSACPGINNSGQQSTWTAACNNQVANTSGLITATNVSNVTVENLRVGPQAVTAVTNPMPTMGGGSQQGIQISSNNVLVTNNQLVWDGDGVDNSGGGTYVNNTISHNYFTENGWGIQLPGPSVDTSGMYINDNWMNDWTAWQPTGTHLNGIYSFNCNSTGGIPILYLWNNAFYGNTGTTGWTAWIHLGNDCAPPGRSWTDGPGVQAWNNLCVVGFSSGNGCMEINGGTGDNIWNNTFIQSNPTGLANGAGCAFQGGNGGGSGLSQVINFQNNVIQGYGAAYCFSTGGVSSITASNNVYGQQGSGVPNYFQYTSSTSVLSTWQSICSCDTGSQAQLGSALSDITGYGYVSAGYIGLLQGANLTTTATGNIATLQDSSTFGGTVSSPKARPTGSAPWDIGAQEISNGQVTLSPTSKNFGSITVGSFSSPTTFTLTNGSSATATSIAPITTGGNSSDFTIVNSGAGSCSAAGNSIAASASCTFTVTFSPTATGSRSTTLSVSYSGGDGASPQTSALSGAGTSVATTGTTISGAAQMIGNNAKIQ